MADIKSKLILDNTQFNKAAKTSRKLISGVGAGLGAVAGAARTASIALVGVAAAFTATIAVSTRYIDRLGKVSKTTGFAAETLQKFQFAAEQSGVSADQAAVALRRFARRLGEAQKGTGELAPTLKKLGIDLFTTSGRLKTAQEVLFELADGINGARNESEQLAIAFKAFDSEGAELVETLRDGSAGLRAFFDEADNLGFVLSTSAIQGVEDFADEFNRLQKVISGLVNQFTAALAPALQDVNKTFREFIQLKIADAGGLEEFGKFLKDEFLKILASTIKGIESLLNAIISFANVLALLLNRIGKLSLIDLDIFPELNLNAREQELQDYLKEVKQVASAMALGDKETSSFFDTIKIDVDDVIAKLKEFGFATEELEGIADRMRNKSTLLSPFEFRDISDEFVAALPNLDKQLFKTKDFSGFIDMLLGNLEENKAAAQEQVDAIEEVVVTGQNLIGETLLGKIFGVGPVQRFWDQWYESGEKSLERFSAVAGLVLGVELVEKIKQGFENSDIGDFTKTLADGLVKGVQMFEDSLADAIVNGKADFSDLADHLKQVLAKAMVQKFVTGPIMALFGLAGGGPAKAGQPYIVGEEGPELFVPKQSGTVIPNDQTMAMAGGAGMGGGGQVTYNINAVDARSFKQLVASDPEYLYNVTQVGARRQPR